MKTLTSRHSRMSVMEKNLIALSKGLNERLAAVDEVIAALIDVAGKDAVKRALVAARALNQEVEITKAVSDGVLVQDDGPATEGSILRFETRDGTTFAQFEALPEAERNAVAGAKKGDTLSDGTQVTGAWRRVK